MAQGGLHVNKSFRKKRNARGIISGLWNQTYRIIHHEIRVQKCAAVLKIARGPRNREGWTPRRRIIFLDENNEFPVGRAISQRKGSIAQYQKLDLTSFIDNPFPRSATRCIKYGAPERHFSRNRATPYPGGDLHVHFTWSEYRGWLHYYLSLSLPPSPHPPRLISKICLEKFLLSGIRYYIFPREYGSAAANIRQ